jgi:hypothetical protein
MIFIFTDPNNGNEIIIDQNNVRVEIGNGFTQQNANENRPNNTVWINGENILDPNKTSPEKAREVFDEIMNAILNGNMACDIRTIQKQKEQEPKEVIVSSPRLKKMGIRDIPVKDLTPQQCRDLMVHAHVCSKERRKAYLLKGFGNEGQVFLTPAEEGQIWKNIDNGI